MGVTTAPASQTSLARGARRVPRLPAAAAGLGLLAVLVSGWGSWVPSLWGDEVTSVMSAQRPWGSLVRMLGHIDVVHGLYYAGLHVWGSVFGFSAFSVRLPEAVAVGAATAGVVVLAGMLRSLRVAVLAGAVCAVLPRVTYMGEEARTYAFSAVFAVWLTVVLVSALRRPGGRGRWWVLYGAVLCVGTYAFLYVALMALVHAAVLCSVRAPRRVWAGWAAACGGAAAAAVPLLVFAVLERGQIAYLGSSDQLGANTLYATLWFGAWPFATAAWALALLGCLAEARRRRRTRAVAAGAAGSGSPGGVPRMPSLTLVAGVWLVLPAAALIGLQLLMPAFTARYLSFCAPAAAILVASGVEELLRWRAWAGIAACAALAGLVAPVYLAQRTPFAKNDSDFAQISAAVGARARPGDAVVFDESINLYRRPRLAMRAYPAGFRDTHDVTLQTPYPLRDTWHDSAYTVPQAAALGRFDGVARVWLIEYDPASGKADTYGAAALEKLGYRPSGTPIRGHRSLIALYTRAS